MPELEGELFCVDSNQPGFAKSTLQLGLIEAGLDSVTLGAFVGDHPEERLFVRQQSHCLLAPKLLVEGFDPPANLHQVYPADCFLGHACVHVGVLRLSMVVARSAPEARRGGAAGRGF